MRDLDHGLDSAFVAPSILKSDAITRKISRDLAIAVHELRSSLHFVKAVYLGGGYSRAEGTVLSENGRFEYLSDYDLFVDTRSLRLLNQYIGKKLEASLTCRLGIPVEIRILPRNLPRRILFYELGEEGLCLHGEDSLSRRRFAPGEIEAFDGVRLLLNRMHGLVVAVDKRFPDSPESEVSRRKITKECSKGLLAVAESLLLLSGHYAPTYQERNAVFQKVFPGEFADLRGEMPDLVHHVELATRWKLDPRQEFDMSAVELWFRVRDYMIGVLGYYVDRISGVDGTQEVPIQVENFLVSANPQTRLPNLKYFTLLYLARGEILPSILLLSPPAPTRFRASMVYAVASISPEGHVAPAQIQRASELLQFLIGTENLGANASNFARWKRLIDLLQRSHFVT